MDLFSVSGFERVLTRVLPEPHAGLMSGLLFGSKVSLSPEFIEALTRSGTLHIVALSGMNIAIIARLMETSIASVWGKRPATLGTLMGIVWFVWFVGPSPSLVRAAIMGGIALMAHLFGRQYWGLVAWAVTVCSMLIINREWSKDLSFQLSALATLGIILFGGGQENVGAKKSLAGKVLAAVTENIRLTLAAQLFTVPLIFWQFQRISFIAPLSNLMIGWIIAPLTILGWLTVLAGFLWFPLSYSLSWFDWILLEYVIRTVYLMGSFPLGSLGR